MPEFENHAAVDESESKASAGREPAIKRGWLRAILFIVVATIGAVVFGLVGFLLISAVSGIDLLVLMEESTESTAALDSWQMIILQGFTLLGTMFFVWLFRRFIDRQSVASLGFTWRGYQRDFWSGSLWGVALLTVGFVILYLLGNLTITGYQFNAVTLLGSFILFIMVALSEEIMIRGYFLTNLMDSMNKYVALGVSSLLFTLMHGVNSNMGILPAVNLFLAGIVLGIYFIFKRNLWFSVGMHLTWNFFQGPIYGFEVSGEKTASLITQEVSGSSLLSGGLFGFEGSLLATLFITVLIITLFLQFRTPKEKTPVIEV